MVIRAASIAVVIGVAAVAGAARAGGARAGRMPRRAATISRSRATCGSAATTSRPGSCVDLTRKIDIRAFTLADPYRVVIDLPQVTFQFPPRDRRAAAAA